MEPIELKKGVKVVSKRPSGILKTVEIESVVLSDKGRVWITCKDTSTNYPFGTTIVLKPSEILQEAKGV